MRMIDLLQTANLRHYRKGSCLRRFSIDSHSRSCLTVQERYKFRPRCCRLCCKSKNMLVFQTRSDGNALPIDTGITHSCVRYAALDSRVFTLLVAGEEQVGRRRVSYG